MELEADSRWKRYDEVAVVGPRCDVGKQGVTLKCTNAARVQNHKLPPTQGLCLWK